MKILLRADGNRETGLGHLYRIRAMWEIFHSLYACVVISRQESDLTMFQGKADISIIPNSNSISEEPGWLVQQFPAEEYSIILDGYGFGFEYQSELKSHGYHLLYIDDLMTHQQVADVVVNHAIGIEAAEYKTGIFTRLALGTAYAILRKEFLEVAKKNRMVNQPLNTALVCFGGSDNLNFSLKATEALLHFQQLKKIHVVVGSSYQGNELQELQKRQPEIEIHRAVKAGELVGLMQDSQMAVASASTILYELCAAKIPVLAGHYVANQKKLYEGMLASGSIFGLGDMSTFESNDFKKAIAQFLEEGAFEKYQQAQAALLDGKSGERLLGLMNRPVLRLATSKDMKIVFEWSNDPVTRQNSFNQNPIDLETHQNWFANRLSDPNTFMCIAEIEKVPVGLVRFQIADNEATIGVLIDKKFRGKGLATGILKDAIQSFRRIHSEPIHAWIKKENVASIQAFKKAGFEPIGEEVVNGYPSIINRFVG